MPKTFNALFSINQLLYLVIYVSSAYFQTEKVTNSMILYLRTNWYRHFQSGLNTQIVFKSKTCFVYLLRSIFFQILLYILSDWLALKIVVLFSFFLSFSVCVCAEDAQFAVRILFVDN